MDGQVYKMQVQNLRIFTNLQVYRIIGNTLIVMGDGDLHVEL